MMAGPDPGEDAGRGAQDVTDPGDDVFRLLIVATEETAGEILADVIKGHLGGRKSRVHLVAPAITDTFFEQASGDVDDAILRARERMTSSLSDLRREGIDVSGGVGDSDPILAIDDELSQFPADEILIVTHPERDAGWMEDDLFERAREKFRPEITHVVLAPGDDGEMRPTYIEHADAGVDDMVRETSEIQDPNLPPMTSRDIASIIIGIVGTLILIFLAATCGGDEVNRAGESTIDTGCMIRYMLAGAAFLINVAHIVGLLFFSSVGYRGFWEKWMSRLSIYGTPLAIIVSLLVA